MDNNEAYKNVDHKRWLMNNGLFDDSVKNDLFFYGSICHPAVRALDFSVHVEQKTVSYKVFLDQRDLDRIKKFNKLSKATSLFGLWRYKRMLKKYGNLDPAKNLTIAIKDFAGPSWKADVEVLPVSHYDSKPYEEGESEEFGPGAEAHRIINRG